MFPHLKLLVPLALLFSTSVSPLKTQGDYLLPQQQGQPYYSSQADASPAIQRFAAPSVPVLQASNRNWTEPVLLFEEDGTGEIHSPFVISDSYGSVHVFWSVIRESQGESDLIYYTRLDAIGWTTPVDIVAATPARAAKATIAQDGFIYLIWNGLDGISYSRAPLQKAEFVNNWSEPVPITNGNIHADLFTSASGNIYLAYPGVGTSGVFEQSLDITNQSWSSSRMVSQTSLTNTASDYVQIGVGDKGIMHVVWTEFYYPEGWPPRGIFYSRSIDGGDNWSVPELLAGDGFDQVNIAVTDDNNIHVVWNGMVGLGGRYNRWSSDGGQTWSETVEVIPAGVGGTEGLPQLVVDASGTLQLLTTYNGCAWYTYFKNRNWVTPVCISGEQARASNYIEEPAMAVSEGNKLHAVFWDDRKRLWYTTKVTDAPWIAPEKMENELPQPAQSAAPTSTPVIMPIISPTIAPPVQQQLDASSRFNLNPAQLLILSLSPVILLVLWIAALIFFKKKN